MNTLFALLCVVSFVVLCIGIVKPHVLYRWFPENKQNRKSVAMIFGIATLAFFILFAATDSSASKDLAEEERKAEEQAKEDEEKAKQEEEQRKQEEEEKKKAEEEEAKKKE